MSDERFERWNDHCCKVKDNQEGILLNLQEVVVELGATLLVNGFEIEINGENLSELIDDE